MSLDAAHEDDDTDGWTFTENEVLKTYEPLLEGQIRLLQLLPGKDDKIAISYAWGKSSNITKLMLNDKLCWRKHNLLECLESLRHESEIHHLWVDALCINQTDTIEKSAQINLMPQIYRLATRTLIWLGKDEAYDVGHDMKYEYDPAYTKAKPRSSEGLGLLNHFAQDGHLRNDRHFYEMSYMLAQISRFEWWCRVWVVQETLLSDSAFLVLGRFMLSWKTAYRAAIRIAQHLATCCNYGYKRSKENVYQPAIREYLAECAQVILSFRHVPSGTNNTLLATLWMFRNRLASIRHDKIYGVLGLIPSRQSSIQPDYTKPFEQVCRIAVLEDIRTSGNLNALRGSRTASRDFSSWSTDWSDLDYWTEDRSRILCDLYEQTYCASGSTKPRINDTRDKDVQPAAANELRVAGHIFDVVSYVGDRMCLSEDLDDDDITNPRPPLLKSANKVCARIQDDSYTGGGSVPNACWRTLLGDSLTTYHDSANPLHSLQNNSSGAAVRRVKASDFFAFTLWRKTEIEAENSRRDKHWQRSQLSHSVIKNTNVPAIRNIKASVIRATSGRCMFRTDKGYIGLGPEFIEDGDKVAVLMGGATPFVIREEKMLKSGQQAWTLVGDCYVHGWMDGEMMRDQNTDEWEDLVLV